MGAVRRPWWRRVCIRVVVPLACMLLLSTSVAYLVDRWLLGGGPLLGRPFTATEGAEEGATPTPEFLSNLPERALGGRSAREFMRHSLTPGEPAPELVVPSLEGGESFDLAKYRGVKPVVLVFGSF